MNEKPAWKRWLRRAACILVTCYLVVILVFYGLQTRMIFPGAVFQGTVEARFVPPAGCELLDLRTAEGEQVKALFGPALMPDGSPYPQAARQPTILYFYGNAMATAACLDTLADFRRLGANVLIPDYVGYGLSSGRPSELACYATATAAYDWLVHSGRVDPKKIIVGGWSLGAAVAIDLAARQPVAGLMACSAFTSLVDAGQRLYPFLPVRWLCKFPFPSIDKMPRVTCPTIIAHGTIDELVPLDMAGQLARAAGGPVTQVTIEGAWHNDLWLIGGDQVLGALRTMIERTRIGN